MTGRARRAALATATEHKPATQLTRTPYRSPSFSAPSVRSLALPVPPRPARKLAARAPLESATAPPHSPRMSDTAAVKKRAISAYFSKTKKSAAKQDL